MNRKGDMEISKVVDFIIKFAVLVIIIGGLLFVIFRPAILKAGDFSTSISNALDKTGLSDIFKKAPSDLSQMTEGQKNKLSNEKQMDTLFQEGNSFSSDIENFDIKQCSQDFINRFDTAYKKYEEYVKNCNDPKAKYYSGCKQTGMKIIKLKARKKWLQLK